MTDNETLEILDNLTKPPANPAQLLYPATLPLELALRTASHDELKIEYKLNQYEWECLLANEQFRADVARYNDLLKKEGASFRLKAQLQSEGLLETIWGWVHDNSGKMPAAVKADMAKFIIRVAGLDASKDQAGASVGTALQINISL